MQPKFPVKSMLEYSPIVYSCHTPSFQQPVSDDQTCVSKILTQLLILLEPTAVLQPVLDNSEGEALEKIHRKA